MAGKRDTKSPVQAEAEDPAGSSAPVMWDGHTYSVPASLDDVDLDALEALADGNALGFARGCLGPDQWQLLKERSRGKPHRFAELRNEIAKAMGFVDEGESEASSG